MSFEREFATWSDTKYAIAVANGSLALSLAYLAIGIKPGDELITSPRTFVATASSAALLQAIPIFCDVDLNSGCITADFIAPLITPRTKAISVVHLGGWPADMESIIDLARAYEIAVIEDCAQAHGARLCVKDQWHPVGSFGDVAAWSFCQDKIMSTGGEGGMATTSNAELWDLMWSFKDHGKTWDAVYSRSHSPGFRWLHERFGSNFRMTEIQSVIGRIQLSKMHYWHAMRSRNAAILTEALSDCSCLRIPMVPNHCEHAWYKFHCYIVVDALADGWSRDRVVAEISSSGFPALHGSCSEIYLEKCFQACSFAPSKRLSNARELGDTSLMFLVHPTITSQQMADYASTIRLVLKRACR